MPIFQSAEAGAGTNFNSTAALAFQKEKHNTKFNNMSLWFREGTGHGMWLICCIITHLFFITCRSWPIAD